MSSADYPIDGFGGLLYRLQFQVPVYNVTADEVYQSISWYDIDVFYRSNAVLLMTTGVGLAICLVTFLNIVAITPSQKRKLPIQIYLLVSLFFYVVADIIMINLLLHSPMVSAYIDLTLDIDSVTFTTTYVALLYTHAVTSGFGLIFVQICMILQVRTLLVVLRLQHTYWYWTVITILGLAGFLDVCFSATILVLTAATARNSVHVILSLWFIASAQKWVLAISFGGCSLVFFLSAIRILMQRKRLNVGRNGQNNSYDFAITLISIVGLDSFIIPIILLVLTLSSSFLTAGLREARTETLIPRIILFLLPLSSLFGSTSAAVNNDRNRNEPVAPLQLPARTGEVGTQQSHTAARKAGDYISVPTTAAAVEMYTSSPTPSSMQSDCHAAHT